MKSLKRRTQQKREAAATHLVKLLRNGQITLPRALRDKLGLNVGDYLKAAVEEGAIVLRPIKFVNTSKEERGK
jgi:AbrB family looped-hinge helix DNA binding protein